MEKLSAERMTDVKILDVIQLSTPEKAWLDKVDVNSQRVQIIGFAVTDSDITALVDNLAKSVYFSDVSLLSASEQSNEQTGVIKRFEISCKLEKTL
jgi:Tfp pilus assembly protein PilN